MTEVAAYKSDCTRCPCSVNTICHGVRDRVGPIWGKAAVLALLTWCLVSSAAGAEADNAPGQRKLDPRLPRYFVTKEREARWLTKELKLQVAPEIWEYFDAGSEGDWTRANELFDGISRQWREGDSRSAIAGPVLEAVLAYEGFTSMEMKFVEAFARDVINSIPRGSIYFGGTDPGRGLITTFVKSLPKADPFFVLSQNPLGDRTYLEYVRAMYGRRIHIPSDQEWKKAMDDYSEDVAARMKTGQLKRGETVFEGDDGKLKPQGTAAFMAVNALLAKIIFTENPNKDFYVEESFPIDWMYPHLSPHGLIMKINRKPLTTISEKMVQEDRAYWSAQTKRWIGGWLTNETPVKVLCEFLEDVYGQARLEDFKADEAYVMAGRGHSPRFLYGHLRLAQARVYEWQMDHATTSADKDRMRRELDFAYRQTIALFPEDVETIRRYVNLLRDQKRTDDARQVLEAGQLTNPRSKRLQQLADELEEN